MKNIYVSLILISLMISGCMAAAFVAPAMIASSQVDKGNKIASNVIREYPFLQDSLWSQTYLMLQEKGYKIKRMDRPNGFIETDWVTEKYSPSVTHPDLNDKMKRYGSSIDPDNVAWNGMRYKYTVRIVGITTQRSQIHLEARMDGLSYSGSGLWRWWNSNGTLEELFFANLNYKLGYTPPESLKK